TPEQEWLLGMAETARAWLREGLDVPFLGQDEVLKEFDLIASGRKPFSWKVWRWINFARWNSLLLA
ncbi:MAG TPA: asparagine synthetase B, partial [Accumulibacter sp.]|nr:asparagine synthetase B [Accumulibacter sp.]